jgi:virginiamycin B lyase
MASASSAIPAEQTEMPEALRSPTYGFPGVLPSAIVYAPHGRRTQSGVDGKKSILSGRSLAMRTRSFFSMVTTGLAVILLQAGLSSSRPALAENAAALTGQVTSEAEGPMEGVLVSAKKAGSNITVTVVSDQKGNFSFPAAKLEPGQYSVRIRAVGYDLDGSSTKSVDVAAQNTARVDLKLRKTKNLPIQLTNAEWLASMPGTEEQKSYLLNCVGCHTLERVVRSTHDADEWTQVIWRMMGYAQVSQPIKPQRRMDPEWAGQPEQYRKPAEYLASINLSSSPQWEYPLKTLPRPAGRATHVVITEYDLPRPTIEPHDVIVDEQGIAWYTNFGEQFLGRLDPKTGKATEISVPEFKPGYPVGMLDLETDKAGNLWMGMMFQGAIAKFDPETSKFQFFPVPGDMNDKVTQLNMLGLSYNVDGKVWTNNAGNQDIYRIDLKTGTYEKFQPLKQLSGGPYSIYGITSDSKNNLWFMEFLDNYIGRIDAKTGHITFLRTPTSHSRNRRGYIDAQDRLWFAEYRGNKIAMLDTTTEKFAEYPMPTAWTGPYFPTVDKNGEIWTGGMTTDRVVRLDTKTRQSVEYLLPRDTNIRRVFVDNSTNPVTFWTGSNHGASIVKVEPQD